MCLLTSQGEPATFHGLCRVSTIQAADSGLVTGPQRRARVYI